MEKVILIKSFSDQISKERGSTMVEYAMMVALVAAGCVISIRSVGKASQTNFEWIESKMGDAGIGPGSGDPEPE